MGMLSLWTSLFVDGPHRRSIDGHCDIPIFTKYAAIAQLAVAYDTTAHRLVLNNTGRSGGGPEAVNEDCLAATFMPQSA